MKITTFLVVLSYPYIFPIYIWYIIGAVLLHENIYLSHWQCGKTKPWSVLTSYSKQNIHLITLVESLLHDYNILEISIERRDIHFNQGTKVRTEK